jgi:hypothetical protein
MKRNLDLVRSILLEIESWPADTHGKGVEIEGYSHEEVTYNAFLLHDAGYIDAIVSKTMGGNSIYPTQLTWNGHEFLDEARDKTTWEKAKSVVTKVGQSSFSVLRPVLVRLGAAEAEKVLNHLIG